MGVAARKAVGGAAAAGVAGRAAIVGAAATGAGAAGRGGGAAACSFRCCSALSTSPGLETWDRSIFGLGAESARAPPGPPDLSRWK